MGKKRIFSLSLSGNRRAQASAMWDGEHLIFVELKDINGSVREWLPEALEDIRTKVSESWVVLVDDRTQSFPADVISYNFDLTADNGRTNLQNALDWYFALEGRGAIIFDPSVKRYALSIDTANGMLTAKQDEKGRLLYAIDWMQFTACHRALLMCVAGAVMEEPLSDHWMQVFLGVRPKRKEAPIFPVFRSIRKLNKYRHETFENAVAETETRKCSV